MNPTEFKQMADYVREIERAMGSTRKEVMEEEGETVFVQRRCLLCQRDIPIGKISEAEDIDVLRPALGILQNSKNIIIGKTSKEYIVAGQPLFGKIFNMTFREEVSCIG